MNRPLYEIAEEIAMDWGNPRQAAPYLNAMGQLESMDERYGADDAESIVMYFLSNAGSWKGPVARRVKAELRKMLKGYAKRAGSLPRPERVASAWVKKSGAPPGLRDSEDPLRCCGTCEHFAVDQGACVAYGMTRVRADQTCDAWSVGMVG